MRGASPQPLNASFTPLYSFVSFEPDAAISTLDREGSMTGSTVCARVGCACPAASSCVLVISVSDAIGQRRCRGLSTAIDCYAVLWVNAFCVFVLVVALFSWDGWIIPGHCQQLSSTPVSRVHDNPEYPATS